MSLKFPDNPCPFPDCSEPTRVLDSRNRNGTLRVRRRACTAGHRYNTVEILQDEYVKLLTRRNDDRLP